MIKDKSRIKGVLKVKVLELNEEGKITFDLLKKQYGENRKKDSAYLVARGILFAKYGHIKRHPQTWFEKLLGLARSQLSLLSF